MRCRLAMLALLTCFASAAPNWIRVSSPSVEIFTDSSEKTARQILDRFAILRRVFQESFSAESTQPLRVFVFASESEFEKYRPDPNTAAFYQSDQDRDFIILYEAGALTRFGSHEYVHMVMHHTATRFPAWIEEGVPEFYSTLSINGAKMRVGEPIGPHQNLLASQPWLSAGELALGGSSKGGIFYAESWALVHMLSLSPSWRNGMPEFVKLLTQGTDRSQAFRKAFGRSMEDALTALRIYIRTPLEVTLPAPPAEPVETYPAARMTSVDATLALADLALHTGHRSLARALFLRAARDNPQSPAAIFGLGSLALAEDRQNDARREFERAVAMGGQDAAMFYQLALLNNDNALLDKTLALDPHFAEAHFLLGSRGIDDAKLPAAIEHLRQAVALKPRRFSYWHALAYAQAKSGDRRAASESARRAANIARTPQEEQMAASLTQLAAEIPSGPSAAKKPAVITPASWQNRMGDTRFEGMLTHVDCESTPVRLHFSPTLAASETLDLIVPNPTEVELVNAGGSSATLSCGPQSQPVVVEYVAAGLLVTRIEFKRAVIIKR